MSLNYQKTTLKKTNPYTGAELKHSLSPEAVKLLELVFAQRKNIECGVVDNVSTGTNVRDGSVWLGAETPFSRAFFFFDWGRRGTKGYLLYCATHMHLKVT